MPGTQYTEFYLHSSGNDSDVEGDGVLSHTAPALEPADSYSYDPRDPVMSIFTMGQGMVRSINVPWMSAVTFCASPRRTWRKRWKLRDQYA